MYRSQYANWPKSRANIGFRKVNVRNYGSKPNGTDDAESDIDPLVLTSRVLAWRERTELTDALFEISLAHGLLSVADRVEAAGVQPMTPEKINAEIKAYRTERTG